MLREFVTVFKLYHKAHPAIYSLRTAWRIAVQRMPF